ncbi:nitroreductase family protein [Candidatus Woesearchaeota archaeon]|nr:nitroreductase family protein [Candidatus Woesearchaeota archaeon]
MDVFECIATRRSIRKFMDVDVPMELIGTVLDAARYAPSSGNVQNWRFILVKDKAKIGKIADAAMQQLWIANAPMVIVVCGETEKLKQFYGIRGERLYSIQNCAACIQNMLLAAHAVGLASCWVGAFEEDHLRRILGIPEDIRPQALLPIGYPDEVVPAPMHFTLENLCYFDTYGNRIINISRIFQNPNVMGRVSTEVKNIGEIGKKIIDKAKEKLSKK